jgi:hypothetical protein
MAPPDHTDSGSHDRYSHYLAGHDLKDNPRLGANVDRLSSWLEFLLHPETHDYDREHGRLRRHQVLLLRRAGPPGAAPVRAELRADRRGARRVHGPRGGDRRSSRLRRGRAARVRGLGGDVGRSRREGTPRTQRRQAGRRATTPGHPPARRRSWSWRSPRS